MKTFKWSVPEPSHPDLKPTPIDEIKKWKCPKCESENYEVGEFHAAGGKMAKLFDIQNTKFSTITCTRCRYTEIYKCDKETLGNVFDFFVGN